MLFIPYAWKQGELESLCSNNKFRNECLDNSNESSNRFGGLVLPFIGGLLVGGLFMPRPNFNAQPAYTSYPQPPMYIPPQGYYYTNS